jgi:hypothetical protein
MTQITSPTIELAAKVKKALDAPSTDVAKTFVGTSYGNFYVRTIELVYQDGQDVEVVGYLIPDEADGNTFDFWTEIPPHIKNSELR